MRTDPMETCKVKIRIPETYFDFIYNLCQEKGMTLDDLFEDILTHFLDTEAWKYMR